MANPDFLDILGEDMGRVYAATHDRLLINLARHFGYVKDGVLDSPNASFQYQARKLAEMGQVTKESVDIIMKMMGGGDAALRSSLEAAILDSLEDLEPQLREAAQAGLINNGVVPPKVPVRMMQAFQEYYQQSADKMNLVNTVMLESTENAYRSTVSDIVNRMQRAQTILNNATGQLILGADDFNSILKDATQKMVDNGITGFVDRGGHRWAPETYIEMDMRTTYHNASRAAFWERNAEYTNDLYLVSQHPGARPLCYPWQCKVISRTDGKGWVRTGDGQQVQVWAQSEIPDFGYGGSLFGVNCGHYPMPFIPSVTKVPEVRQDEEDNAKQYAESQQQRALEREFRRARLDLDVAKAQGADEETIKAAKAKIKRVDAKLNQFCDETGRKRRREREYAPVDAKWPTGTKPTQTSAGNGNVAQQATSNVPDRDIFKNVKGVDTNFQQGMADVLNKSPSTAAKMLYKKYADDLNCVNPNLKKGAYFKASTGGVHMNVKNVAAGSSYEEPYQVAFHEFGHQIDWMANGKTSTYLSQTTINGQGLLDVIKSDFQAFKQSLGVSKAADVIPILKAENMDLKTCGNISDILEKCTGKGYPLGVGHGVTYHRRVGATEREFFAEVLDSAVANRLSYDQMVRLFPNAVDWVWDAVRSVI